MTVDDIILSIEKGMQRDGGANFIQMLEGMGLIGQAFSILSGIMVALIIIMMPIVIAIEAMYLNLPFMQNKVDNLVLRTNGRLRDAMEITIKDAKKALVIANTQETGRSVNYEYLKIKIKAIFIAALIVGIVLGIAPALVAFLWKLGRLLIEGFNMAI